MGVVNLGNIKHAPIVKLFRGIQHVWSDAEKPGGDSIKLDIPFVFSKNKTYLVLIRSYSGKVTTDDGEISVRAIKIFTNRIGGASLSGGIPFNFLNNDYSFGITFPNYSVNGDIGVYIVRPEETDAVSLFDVGIYEL